MSLSTFKNKTALITGASSGIGESFARILAGVGSNLIIVARREERLQALKTELEAAHAISVTVITMDLSQLDAAKALFEQTEGAGQSVDILLNNAGYGLQENFNESDLDRQLNSMDLMVRSLTALSHYFGKAMQTRGEGYMLHVGSIASYLPVPQMATYGASKAYVRSFGRALHHEYKQHNIHVTVLNPGGTLTEFFDTSGQQFPAWMMKLFFMSADKTALLGLKSLAKNRSSIIAGWSNTFMMASMRLVPECLQGSLAGLIFK